MLVNMHIIHMHKFKTYVKKKEDEEEEEFLHFIQGLLCSGPNRLMNSYITSIAFLIILASNSAGVNMSPMISLSKFFDSSDFRSFISS